MENGEAGYRLLEHTADAGLEAWGPDPARAFSVAARGMFEIVLGQDPAEWAGHGPAEELRVEVAGHSWPDLLVNWLAELVYYFDVEGFVPLRVEFERCEPPECRARVEGTRLQDPGEAAGVGIKAITYHQLEVKVQPNRTDLRVYFDI